MNKFQVFRTNTWGREHVGPWQPSLKAALEFIAAVSGEVIDYEEDSSHPLNYDVFAAPGAVFQIEPV